MCCKRKIKLLVNLSAFVLSVAWVPSAIAGPFGLDRLMFDINFDSDTLNAAPSTAAFS
jgi:hypothetical protein